MSKSRGNVVSPASIVERVGADTARCYILFVGPPDQDADWSDAGVEGVHRFLGRLWRLAAETAERAGAPERAPPTPVGARGDDLALLRKAHWAIDKVSGDLRRFAFNTAIAAVMELLNDCSRLRDAVALETLRFALGTAASLLFPFAPHVCADVYERLTGERVWEQPLAGRRRGAAGARRLRARLPGQRQAARPRAGRVRRDARRAQAAVPRRRRTCRRTSTARSSSRRSSCPASSSTSSSASRRATASSALACYRTPRPASLYRLTLDDGRHVWRLRLGHGRAQARLPDPRRRPRRGGRAAGGAARARRGAGAKPAWRCWKATRRRRRAWPRRWPR